LTLNRAINIIGEIKMNINVWAIILFLGTSLLTGCGEQKKMDSSQDTYQLPVFNTKAIEEITGIKGQWNEQEKVFKVTRPRTEIKVSVDNWEMPPFMGLTSWAAFRIGIKAEMMVMGDLVLFEDEVNVVMSAALENGLEVTALHNHFFYENPKVYFMHIGGEGTLQQLASGVERALAAMDSVRKNSALLATGFGGFRIPKESAISNKELDKIFGKAGTSKNGMYKVVFGRNIVMDCGCKIGAAMGVNTWAAFAGTDDKAVVDGDFAVKEEELQSVLKSLRKSGINVVAIHHHMTLEKPKMLFLHYWGKGNASYLAEAVVKALEITKD
jgi:hypothetical protein